VEHARRLVGRELKSVRYYDIDYRREDWAAGRTGPRIILNQAEWSQPTWAYADCDSLDFGIDLEVTDGSVFSVTWDPPGQQEGLGLRQERLLDQAFRPDIWAAVWDVSSRSRWTPLVGRAVTDVQLHYLPWQPPEGFWCPRITLRFGAARVELCLGQGESGREVSPSADNVAVLFDPDALPGWMQPGD
jgi:hypothetical protein